MISFFPEIYPDELLYSLFARYYIRTGYAAYISVAQDLFVNPGDFPDIEFINTLNKEVINIITRNISFDNIILKHTMFPYYSKFLPYERKLNAYRSFVNMEGNFYNLLPIPRKKNNELRCLKYCPLCVITDREKYGETYWHRVHQLIGTNICIVHNCYLVNSNIPIVRKSSLTLVTAEEIIKNQTPVYCKNAVEIEVSKYLVSVFQSDFTLNKQPSIGQFLHSQMDNTIYKSVRGEQRNISLFHKDFSLYYNSLPNNRFTELWQIQKVLSDNRINFYEICLLANFLKIPINKLNTMTLPNKTQQELFDEQIFLLRRQGLKYPEISQKLNASLNTVKCIGEKKYGTYHKQLKKAPLKSGAKANDWLKIDKDTLPLVKKAISDLQGDSNKRPKKITINAVEKILNIPSKRINNMPLCKAEILKHYETQPQYWAREIVWAVNLLKQNNRPLNWKRIRELTNMKKEDLISCLPYLKVYKNVYDDIVKAITFIE